MADNGYLLCEHRGRQVRLDPSLRSRLGPGAIWDVQLDAQGPPDTWATIQRIAGWHIRPTKGTQVAINGGGWLESTVWFDPTSPVEVALRRGQEVARLRLSLAGTEENESSEVDEQTAPGIESMVPASAPEEALPLPIAPDTHFAPGSSAAVSLSEGSWVTLGREGGPADVKLSGIDLALQHARIRPRGGKLDVQDRSRGIGVLVGGKSVLFAQLRVGQAFTVGHHRVQFLPGPSIAIRPVGTSPILRCTQLRATYKRHPATSLDGVSFDLERSDFMLVVGPSGAGKSTLFRTLLGEIEEVSGLIEFNGEALRGRGLPGALVSFVPQDDHLIGDLTVRETLRITARLRLPRDLPSHVAERRIEEILGRLDLQRFSGHPIESLSGGTRKRVSVGIELLSDPVILILDEPTSGLDEGLDRQLMQLLGELAESGVAVLVVTHSTANLGEARKVLAINRDGHVGYLGEPSSLLSSFDAPQYADVMDRLRRGESASGAPDSGGIPSLMLYHDVEGDRPRRSHAATLAEREQRRMAPGSLGGVPLSRATLRKPLLHLVLAPAIIVFLTYVSGPRGLATGGSSTNTRLTVVLAVLAITTSFFAAALTSSSVVTDLPLLKRESRWGVSASSVAFSRMAVGGAYGAAQGLIAAGLIGWVGRGLDTASPLRGSVVLSLSLCLLSISSTAAGLLVSTIAKTLEQAVFALMGLSIAQVILSGVIVPLGHPDNIGEWGLVLLSYMAPTRWAVSALAADIDINSLNPGTRDGLWNHDLGHVIRPWLAMSILAALFVLLAIFTLRRRLARRM